jgi:hypothetical protein
MTCRNCGGHDYKWDWDEEVPEGAATDDFCCRECLEKYVEWLQAQDKESGRP